MPPGSQSGELSLLNGGDAVHKHPVHALRQLLRALPSGGFVDILQIEEAQVCVRSRRDPALLGEAEAVRWLAGELHLRPDRAHIGGFEMDQCQKVIELCGKMENEEAA